MIPLTDTEKRFNTYGKIFIDLLTTFCKSVSDNIGYSFSNISTAKANEGMIDTTGNPDIKIWEKKKRFNDESYIRMICYTKNNTLFRKQMGNSFYDKQNNSYPVFDCLMDHLQTEILNIAISDCKNNTSTKNYPGDKEIIMYNTVADFLYEIGRYKLNFFNQLSSMSYESNECNGRIIFCDFEYTGLKIKDTFFFRQEYSRIIRKLLEITRNQYYLVVNPNDMTINGIARKFQHPHWKNNYVIQFYSHMHWKLFMNNMSVIECINGTYYIADDSDNLYKETIELENIFSENSDMVKHITELIKIIRKQKHGTTIVMSTDAENETTRLCACNRAISVNKFSILDNKEMLLAATSIDGALVIDSSLTCWAIGAILDGPASQGKVSRGARYNSALSYMQWKKKETELVIVISEDGMVNLVYNTEKEINPKSGELDC